MWTSRLCLQTLQQFVYRVVVMTLARDSQNNESPGILCDTKIFKMYTYNGPRQAILVLIAYASSEGSGEPAHPRSLARTFAARSYKQWIKRNFQTEIQIPGPSEWLDMRSWNLSWRNARRHKFAWRGSNDSVHVDSIMVNSVLCNRCLTHSSMMKIATC